MSSPPVKRREFRETPSITTGEMTQRSAANGRAHLIAGWTRFMARSKYGRARSDSRGRDKQPLHRPTTPVPPFTRVRARSVSVCSTFVLLSGLVRTSLVNQRNRLGNA
jgi:hypothetical protein